MAENWGDRKGCLFPFRFFIHLVLKGFNYRFQNPAAFAISVKFDDIIGTKVGWFPEKCQSRSILSKNLLYLSINSGTREIKLSSDSHAMKNILAMTSYSLPSSSKSGRFSGMPRSFLSAQQTSATSSSKGYTTILKDVLYFVVDTVIFQDDTIKTVFGIGLADFSVSVFLNGRIVGVILSAN